ncbi:MAG: hypothetical protein NZ899_08745 [Thermoguttaceae bacterium]|nr:hypothetical protein [Thermoguttaceae bacterium]MDW8077967.1 hypothetical protein [Thermoguttaceae bacterium]
MSQSIDAAAQFADRLLSPKSPEKSFRKIALYLPLERPETFELVIDGLSWQEKIHPRPRNEFRRHTRRTFSATVLLVIETTLGGSRLIRLAFPARGRNISRSGLGVIASNYLIPARRENGGDSVEAEPLLVNLERVLEPGTSCLVGLRQSDGKLCWIAGRIVRKRSLGGKMQELGIQFESRLH